MRGLEVRDTSLNRLLALLKKSSTHYEFGKIWPNLASTCKDPTVLIAPSSQTVGSLFRVIHEQAKRSS